MVGLAMGMLMLAGCAVHVLDVGLFATTVQRAASDQTGQRVHAGDCVSYLFFIPVQPRFKPDATRLINQAIEQAGPAYDALANAEFTRQWFITLIWNTLCYRIEGTPIDSQAAAAQGSDVSRNVYYHSSRR